MPLKNGHQLDVEIIVDKTIIEVYANGGLMYWMSKHNENLDDFKISLFQHSGNLNKKPKTLVKNLEIHELSSIWE